MSCPAMRALGAEQVRVIAVGLACALGRHELWIGAGWRRRPQLERIGGDPLIELSRSVFSSTFGVELMSPSVYGCRGS